VWRFCLLTESKCATWKKINNSFVISQ
jgi:hypothetical protein